MLIITATELPRHIQCIGSRLLSNNDAPNESNREQLNQGNAAHWLIQQAIADPTAIVRLQDTLAPNGVTIDAAMCGHVAEYLSVIDRPGFKRFVEHDTTLNGGNWRVDARADHVAWDGETLHIDDFKYGYRIVEPANNWTLLAHAIGFRLANDIRPARVILTIYQPRAYHPSGPHRTWEITEPEMMGFHATADRILTEQADNIRTGPHCHHCPKISNCIASVKACLNVIDIADKAVDDHVTNDRLSFELDQLKRAADMVKDRLDALQNLATFRLKKGEIVNNYSLEQGLSNRKWKTGLSPELVNALTGKNVASPKFITPKQAELLGVPEAVLLTLTERVATGMNLKRVSAHDKGKKLFSKKG